MTGSILYFRQDNVERRAYFRRDVVTPVTVRMGRHEFKLKTGNISTGGIGLECFDTLQDLTLRQIRELSDEPVFVHLDEHDLDVRAHLAWLNCENYRAGLVILDVSDSDRWDELCEPQL